MKALVWHGKNDVRVENHEIPDVTEPEDALVKVTCATVCGSDLHLYQGEVFADLYNDADRGIGV